MPVSDARLEEACRIAVKERTPIEALIEEGLRPKIAAAMTKIILAIEIGLPYLLWIGRKS